MKFSSNLKMRKKWHFYYLLDGIAGMGCTSGAENVQPWHRKSQHQSYLVMLLWYQNHLCLCRFQFFIDFYSDVYYFYFVLFCFYVRHSNEGRHFSIIFDFNTHKSITCLQTLRKTHSLHLNAHDTLRIKKRVACEPKQRSVIHNLSLENHTLFQ